MRASEAARRLNKIVDADPISLRRFGRFTKSGKIDPQYNQHIYVLLAVIPALTLFALVFYLLAGIDGFINGTP
jgi:hypothetical protein